jgi:hypothetical protein
MDQYILMVRTRPAAGLEAEYHHWYDRFHLAEVLGVPGFVEARRFQICDTALAPAAGPAEFLAEFTIATDDIDATMAAFDRARALMRTPACLDPASVSFTLSRMITAPVRGAAEPNHPRTGRSA